MILSVVGRKPNHSKISLYPQGHTARNLTVALIDKYYLHSLAPFSSLTHDSIFFPTSIFSFSFQTVWKCRGSWSVLPMLCFFGPRETKMQAHTVTLWTSGLYNFYHSLLFFTSAPQSIPCPVSLPHIARKCRLKASPPTTRGSEITVWRENTPPYNHSNSLHFHVDVHAAGWICVSHTAWCFESALLQIPILWSFEVWKWVTIKHLHIYMHTRTTLWQLMQSSQTGPWLFLSRRLVGRCSSDTMGFETKRLRPKQRCFNGSASPRECTVLGRIRDHSHMWSMIHERCS